MPRKSSGETFVWDAVKEKRLLEKLDDFLTCNSGKMPTIQIYDLWAAEFNVEFGGVHAHGLTLSQKKDRMKKVYKGWKVLQAHTGLGYDLATGRVVCLDEAWQSFIKVIMIFEYKTCLLYLLTTTVVRSDVHRILFADS